MSVATIVARLEKIDRSILVLGGIALLMGVALLDVLTGYELAFSLFYLLPIAFVTWLTTRRLGVLLAIFAAALWLCGDILTGHPYSHPALYLWNAAIRFGFFLIVTLLLANLKTAMETATRSARTDSLTGLANSRSFYEALKREIERMSRYGHPLSIGYVDLDDFKKINDEFGHLVGDLALAEVAKCLVQHLRQTDLVARLGGDEFAVLLPETDQSTAQTVFTKIHSQFKLQLQERTLAVTCSIGVITLREPPPLQDDILSHADNLMYHAKRGGKNRINYAVYLNGVITLNKFAAQTETPL